MHKKVVLIRPQSELPTSAIPLNLLCIGTAAKKQGYQVRIIDTVVERDYFEAIGREVKDAMAVGITTLTSEVSHALEISDYVKRMSDVPIVWGGWHVTLFPEQVCADQSVDFAVFNEGERTFTELLDALREKGSYSRIQGLVYKNASRIFKNPARPFLNLEELPPLDKSLVSEEDEV